MKVLTSPITYILLLGIFGMGSIVTGVQLLAGAGWAAIAGGTMAVFTAALIARGLNHG